MFSIGIAILLPLSVVTLFLVLIRDAWYPTFQGWRIIREVLEAYSRDDILASIDERNLRSGCTIKRRDGRWTVSIAARDTKLPPFMEMIRQLLYARTDPERFGLNAPAAAQDLEDIRWRTALETTQTAWIASRLLNRRRFRNG